MTTHTQGPWIAHKGECAGGHRITGGVMISALTPINLRDYYTSISIATQRNPHPLYGGGISDDQAFANAKIMAAAPEMLSALLEIVGIYEDSEKNNGLAELLARVASKAISKAATK